MSNNNDLPLCIAVYKRLDAIYRVVWDYGGEMLRFMGGFKGKCNVKAPCPCTSLLAGKP